MGVFLSSVSLAPKPAVTEGGPGRASQPTFPGVQLSRGLILYLTSWRRLL